MKQKEVAKTDQSHATLQGLKNRGEAGAADSRNIVRKDAKLLKQSANKTQGKEWKKRKRHVTPPTPIR